MTDPTETTKHASTELNPAHHPGQSAMQDAEIVKRLHENPEDVDAQLDAGLDESMDASDVPTALQPGDTGEPLPSSGFDPDEEARIRAGAQE